MKDDLIKSRMEEISMILMQHETKDFCIAQINPYEWKRLNYENKTFIIVPSPEFKKLILERDYLNVVDKYPEDFGTRDDMNIVRALKKYYSQSFLKKYTDQEYLDSVRNETMAYVFRIKNDDTVSDKTLRLDLCRGINNKVFQGGLFHAFKHFTPEGFTTISSFNKEYIVETFNEIWKNVIVNFFSEDFQQENRKNYVAKSPLKDGHILRGVYYKEENIPVYFLKSIRIESKKSM